MRRIWCRLTCLLSKIIWRTRAGLPMIAAAGAALTPPTNSLIPPLVAWNVWSEGDGGECDLPELRPDGRGRQACPGGRRGRRCQDGHPQPVRKLVLALQMKGLYLSHVGERVIRSEKTDSWSNLVSVAIGLVLEGQTGLMGHFIAVCVEWIKARTISSNSLCTKSVRKLMERLAWWD